MPIFAQKKDRGEQYPPASEDVHEAVLVDIVDLGVVTKTFGPETKTGPYVRYVWEIDELRQDGRRFAISKEYPNVLTRFVRDGVTKTSGLLPVVETLAGRTLKEDEFGTFDQEQNLGRTCRLSLKHKPSADGSRVWANISDVLRSKRPLAPSGEYVREQDRERRASGFQGKAEWQKTGEELKANGAPPPSPAAADPLVAEIRSLKDPIARVEWGSYKARVDKAVKANRVPAAEALELHAYLDALLPAPEAPQDDDEPNF